MTMILAVERLPAGPEFLSMVHIPRKICYCSKVSSLPCFDYWIGQRCTCLLVEKGTGDLKAGGMGGAPPMGWYDYLFPDRYHYDNI